MTSPNFQKKETKLKDIILIERTLFEDNRGSFGKLFNKQTFSSLGLPNLEFRENYYNISQKNVIRGMHFQAAPYGTSKLISCIQGSIIDVVVGIDKENHGLFESFKISSKNYRTLFIPPNYAHGFKALEDNTIVVYHSTEIYYPELDKGVNYNSFGFDWNLKQPIISKRDRFLPPLKDINFF